MVKITWLGHACFLIELSNGYKIVIDPHDGRSIGLPKPSVKADLVLVTHDHFDHNAIDIVRKEDTRVIKSLRGDAHVDDILIKGIRTYHDKEGGRRRGENTIYIIDVEGYKIAHLGDLGHKPMEQLDLLKGVDVLNAEVFAESLQYSGFKLDKIIKREIPSKILPQKRDEKTGRFASNDNANSEAYPVEYIVIGLKE